MLRITLAGLRAHLLRLLLTALAITLGVGFVAGTFVLTDTMKAGYDRQFTASAGKVSVAVLPKTGELAASTLARLKALPGVQDAQGIIQGDAPLVGKDGRVYGDFPTLGTSIETGALQRNTVTAGHLPQTPDEVVLDRTTARRNGFRPGSHVKVLDRKQTPRDFTVAGLVDFGVDPAATSGGAVGFIPQTAMEMTGRRTFVEIDLKTAHGTNVESVRAAAAQIAGGDAEALTGRQLADRLARTSGLSAKELTVFFLAFALVALFVAALVIYNTFNILIAQRLREMALLRCVGAGRGQIFRGVLTESLVVGLVASAAGVLAGIGLGAGGAALFASASDGPASSVVVTATPIVVGMLIGTIVTLISALMPARAATKVAPVAALRQQTEGPVRGRASVVRLIVGSLIGLAGVLAIAAALLAKPGQGPFLAVLAGGMLVFLGVIALSPMLVGRLSGVIGWLPARYLGVPGALARQNAGRNPKRAAITTIALTVGVTLMTMFSVALASSQATADARLTKEFPVDYQLSTQRGGDTLIPRMIAADLRTKPQIADVAEVQEADGKLSGVDTSIGTMSERSLGHTIKPDVVAGSVTALRPGSVILGEDEAKSLNVGLGRQLSLAAKSGAIPLKVVAIVAADAPIPSVTVSGTDFLRAFGAKDDKTVDVIVRKGVPADVSRAIVNDATRAYPLVKVASAADIKDAFSKAIDQLFVLVGALLGLAIIISLIGITNTLTLSVFERTRESALLRALGLTRRGLKRMLSIEAAIMALIGALIGIVLGSAFGWMALLSVAPEPVLGFPVWRVAAFVLIAALAGVLAAVLPGRRAARTSIVESLAAD
jgi:putative ABC transport system permease protein